MSEATESIDTAGFSLSEVPQSIVDLEPQAEPEVYIIQSGSPWCAANTNSRNLRIGEPLSSVFSAHGVGLMAATFNVAWTAVANQTLAPLVAKELLDFSGEGVLVTMRGVRLVAAVSAVTLGLVTDSHTSSNWSKPRWRTCWAIGAVVAACSLTVLASVSLALESNGSSTETAVLAVIFAAMAGIGSTLMELSTLTSVVELSQCEPLRQRGSVLGAYLVIKSASAAAANLFCFAVADSTMMGLRLASKNTVSTALFVAAGVAVIPIPFVFGFWRKLSGPVDSLHIPVLLRAQLLWQITNQRAVMRATAFLLVFVLAVGTQVRDSTIVISSWAGAAGDSDFLVATLRSLAAGAALAIWRGAWMNRSWRSFFLFAAMLVVVPHLVVALFEAGVSEVRNRYFYRVIMTVMYAGQGLASLAGVVPLVEVVQEGMEGSMVGLSLSIQLVAQVFQESISTGVFRGDHFYDFDAQLKSSAPTSGQWKVVGSLLLNFALIAIGAAVAVVVFLPTQKLEIQKLRKHAGYARRGSLAIALTMLTLVAYSLIANALTLDSGLKCSAIASGVSCPS